MKPLNLIILGPQGSGKGTQAELLVKTHGYVMLGAGDSLREVAKTDTDLGRRVKSRVDKGLLVEPEDASEVTETKLHSIPVDQGVIFESYPRTIEQYEHMKKFWPKTGRGDFQAVFIDLPEEESIRRLSARRVCSVCGANYIAGTVEKCQKCGGELVQRHDDYPEAVKNRLSWSNSELLPMVAQMEKEGRVVRVDGRPSIEKVHREILEKLGLLRLSSQ